MKVYIQTNCENYKNELDEVVRAFSPYLLLSEDGMPVSACISVADGKAKTSVSAEGCAPVSGVYDVDDAWSDLYRKRCLKRFLKRDLYDFLSALAGVSLSYGSLTGIRPTKLFYELLDESKNPERELVDYFRVSESKARLIAEIVDAQKGIIGAETDKADWFVNIPFCPSRCHYCSFLSEVIRPKRATCPPTWKRWFGISSARRLKRLAEPYTWAVALPPRFPPSSWTSFSPPSTQKGRSLPWKQAAPRPSRRKRSPS